MQREWVWHNAAADVSSVDYEVVLTLMFQKLRGVQHKSTLWLIHSLRSNNSQRHKLTNLKAYQVTSSPTQNLINSNAYQLKSSPIQKLNNSIVHQLPKTPTHKPINPSTYQPTNLPTHGLTNSRTHQPTHTPTSLWPSKALLRFAFNPLRQVQKIIFTTFFGFILADCTYFLLYRALFAIHLKEQVNDDK